ncbi:hypothetical protein [Halobellus marinus]|uniref:hypothetical protein n=1 Tax=Halobellus TaxID=1073986 RepID=UPI0028B209AE|nr:hypothetical protein [Halobellus sp. DFY28]
MSDAEVLKQILSGDPSEELVEKVASAVVEEFEESFPELSLKSRPLADALEDFRTDKLAEVRSENALFCR